MKKRTKKLITALILLSLAAGTVTLGIFAGRLFAHEDDPLQLSNADIGKTMTFRMSDEAIDGDETNYLLDIDPNPDKNLMLRVIVPDSLVSSFRDAFESQALFSGIIGQSTPEITAENEQYILNYLNMLAQASDSFEVTDAMKAKIPGMISPYYMEMTELGSESGHAPLVRTVCYPVGGLLALAALCMLIAALSGKAFGKIALIAGLILGIPLLIVGIIFFGKIRSVLSVKQVGTGLYSMEYADTLKTDELLKTDIHSIAEMSEWLSREVFCNYPFSIDEKNGGCAAFTAKTAEGNVLMGRNFDYPETDTLMIHTKPKDGYASYAMADLTVFGIGRKSGMIAPDSALGKIIMLAAPYTVVDGLNEAGLGTAILALDIGETHMYNKDKHDLSIYTAIRVLLDKCATVDEAVNLLADQDIHSGLNTAYHLFIADKTGRSVVVEWLAAEMHVNELSAATNSVLTPGRYFDRGADERLPVIQAKLAELNGILTKEQAKEILAAAAQENYTEWSCVYDLTDFSFDVYMDENYETATHFPQ